MEEIPLVFQDPKTFCFNVHYFQFGTKIDDNKSLFKDDSSFKLCAKCVSMENLAKIAKNIFFIFVLINPSLPAKNPGRTKHWKIKFNRLTNEN